MQGVTKSVRQALFAALLFFPAGGWAEVRASLDPKTGAVNVHGLVAKDRAYLIANQHEVFLQSSEVLTERSMSLSAAEDAESLVIEPRYALLPRTTYDLRLGLKNGELLALDLSTQGAEAQTPELLWHSPDVAVIPENTLRLYLMFSEPMAKGRVSEAIWIERSDGTIVDSPFLNLSAELWDPEQRRLTLLFDPGRIKQGVGPNQSDRAPLQAGQRYTLVVAKQMLSAEGKALEQDIRLPLHVGSAQRDAIDPSQWELSAPRLGTRDALRIKFDRVMDLGSSLGRIHVVNASGAMLSGSIDSAGSEWCLTPTLPWTGLEQILVDPKLEDVAGNTPHAAFDAVGGTIGTAQQRVVVAVFAQQ